MMREEVYLFVKRFFVQIRVDQHLLSDGKLHNLVDLHVSWTGFLQHDPYPERLVLASLPKSSLTHASSSSG